MAIHASVKLLEVRPELFQALVSALLVGKLGEHRANGHHHGEITHHVAAQTRALDVVKQMERVHHDTRHAELLVQTLNHGGLVDALALATNEVAIQVDIGVVHGATARQRHVRIDIIHVEGVRRHGQALIAQHIGAIAQAMHEQVLIGAEAAHLVPTKNLLARQCHAVAHGIVRPFMHFLVHVVRDKQVHTQIALDKATQDGKHGRKRLAVQPVIGVDNLIVDALSLAQAGHHGHAMSAVLLVHRTNDPGIASLPLIGLLRRLVVAAIVDDDDLHIGSVGRTLQDRGDAMVHVGSGVVAGDAEGYGLGAGGIRHDRR